ncbi:hypothetical protein Tco_1365082 [Tanacetum coccineum]
MSTVWCWRERHNSSHRMGEGSPKLRSRGLGWSSSYKGSVGQKIRGKIAQTPFAALITRSRGTLLGGLHDDSQSEVFYYAIFISSKTGLGGWSQWSMKMYF